LQRIQKILENPEPPTPAKTPSWKSPFARRSGSNSNQPLELLELLRAYPKYRYQSLVLNRVSGLYVSLRGLLSDQLREVDFCRARLGELSAMYAPEDEEAVRCSVPPAGRFLLPEGCLSLADAVRQVDEAISSAHLLEFDRKVQAMLRLQFHALVQVCTTSSNVLRVLAPALTQEARAFLEPRLAKTDVAEMYLEQRQQQEGSEGTASDALRQEVLAAHQKATPNLHLAGPTGEILVVGTPASQGGAEFRGLTRDSLGAPRVGEACTDDEIVFYREYTSNSLFDLEHLGAVAQEAYQRVIVEEAFTPHSRIDVPQWRPSAPVAAAEPGRLDGRD
jgi:hypothetical protein